MTNMRTTSEVTELLGGQGLLCGIATVVLVIELTLAICSQALGRRVGVDVVGELG